MHQIFHSIHFKYFAKIWLCPRAKCATLEWLIIIIIIIITKNMVVKHWIMFNNNNKRYYYYIVSIWSCNDYLLWGNPREVVEVLKRERFSKTFPGKTSASSGFLHYRSSRENQVSWIDEFLTNLLKTYFSIQQLIFDSWLSCPTNSPLNACNPQHDQPATVLQSSCFQQRFL